MQQLTLLLFLLCQLGPALITEPAEPEQVEVVQQHVFSASLAAAIDHPRELPTTKVAGFLSTQGQRFEVLFPEYEGFPASYAWRLPCGQVLPWLSAAGLPAAVSISCCAGL